MTIVITTLVLFLESTDVLRPFTHRKQFLAQTRFMVGLVPAHLVSKSLLAS